MFFYNYRTSIPTTCEHYTPQPLLNKIEVKMRNRLFIVIENWLNTRHYFCINNKIKNSLADLILIKKGVDKL